MDILLGTFSVFTRTSAVTGFADVLTFHQVTCLSQKNQLSTSQILNDNEFGKCYLEKKKV